MEEDKLLFDNMLNMIKEPSTELSLIDGYRQLGGEQHQQRVVIVDVAWSATTCRPKLQNLGGDTENCL